MTLRELIAELNHVLAEHPDLADRDVTSRDGDYTMVRVDIPDEPVERVTTRGFKYNLVKGLIVG